MPFQARIAMRGRTLADGVERADSFWTRAVGLLGRSALPAGQGLWIEPCSQIHTLFMKFPIDAVFLDRERRVLRVYRAIRPWRLSAWLPRARSVLELPAGAAEGVEAGDTIDFVEAASRGPRHGS